MSFFKKIASVFSVFLLLFGASIVPADALTTRQERELGDKLLEAVHAHYDVINDPLINDYIDSLGEKLTRELPPQPFEFSYHVIREDKFNAFAGPGGNIFIFSGLIEAMDTENELAAIMAHEIAHVTAGHIPDMIERSQRTGYASMAGMIAGILVGLGGAPSAGAAISLGSIAAGQTMMLSYSREHELQADFLGLKTLEDAGYHEYGMLSALKRIRSREWFGEDEIPTYLKTHPAAAERMAMLGGTMTADPAALKNTYAFDRARMRIMALYGNRGNALNRLSRMARADPENPAIQYGLGLVLAEGGNPEKGISHLETAASLKPDDPHITIALGKAFFLAGDNTKAIETLKAIDDIQQYGPEGMIVLGRTRMSEGDNREVVETFKKLLDHYPNDRQALFFLGQSLGQQGDLAEAHYFLGRYHKAERNFENARFHFDRALSKARDPEKKADIEKRMDALDPDQE